MEGLTAGRTRWLRPGRGEALLRVEALTPRERETFRLLGQGRRTAEIAHHLGISLNTARVFIAAVRVKLGRANRPSRPAHAGPAPALGTP